MTMTITIGKPCDTERTQEEIDKIAYTLTRKLSKNFNKGLKVFFKRYASNDFWYDFRLIKIKEDITLLGQLIESYEFTAESGNEPKYIASIDKLVINGQEFYSIQD
jgi:hypothetical protein